MINGEKVGVGIITCNRKEKFKRLFLQVVENDAIDQICIVKNKDFNYGDNDPILLQKQSKKVKAFHVSEDLGVGHCKNVCMQFLLENSCQHIFIIEDDVFIKDPSVFQVYADTARAFGLGHLNFNRAWNSQAGKFLEPWATVSNGLFAIELFERLCGDFQYFTRKALEKVGLFDEKDYVNALEHAEHSYRLYLALEYTPYYAFADIQSSDKYLADTGEQSTIDYGSNLFNQRVKHGAEAFKKKYGYYMMQIPRKSPEEVKAFLQVLQQKKEERTQK